MVTVVCRRCGLSRTLPSPTGFAFVAPIGIEHLVCPELGVSG
jgi:hypothetical protein